MAKRTTYTHVIRNGKPVVVKLPRKGSTDEAMSFKENVIVGAITRGTRRLFGR